jgi:oligoribonuclease NrnB/cAMP/cGMP phosphodiesterase (DHH superfamily)
MKDLLEITPNVIWIDHHKTSIDKYKDFKTEIKGIRYSDEDNPISGCMLTWLYIMYFSIKIKGSKNDIDKKIEPEFLKQAPKFIQLIDDWDVWKLKHSETKAFISGCQLYDTNPESEFWEKVTKETNEMINKITQEGEVCIRYKDNWSRDLLRNYGFETKFEGYRCFAVNLGRCNSDYFKSVFDKNYDIWISFVYDGESWIVNLYSTTIDVSEIAQKYGGGGHTKASGFVTKDLIFKKGK